MKEKEEMKEGQTERRHDRRKEGHGKRGKWKGLERKGQR